MKDKLFKSLLVTSSVALALVGCGNKEEAQTQTTEAATTTQSSTSSKTSSSSSSSSSSEGQTTYTISEEDTLASIADRYEVSVEAISEANNLAEDAELLAGDELIIPTDSPVESSETEEIVEEATEDTEVIEEDVEAEYIDNPDAPEGVRTLLTEGVPRQTEIAYEVVTVDGEEQSRTEIAREVIQEGSAAQISVGSQIESDTITDGTVINDPAQGLSPGDNYNGYAVDDVVINESTPLLTIDELPQDSKRWGATNNGDNKNYMVSNGSYYALPLAAETISAYNSGQLLDFELLNQYFIELLNAERTAAGLNPLAVSNTTQQGTAQRSLEMAQYGDLYYIDPETGQQHAHIRPDGSSYATAFANESGQLLVGENMLQLGYSGNPFTILSEQFVAEQIFDLWKNSPSHYENMMDPDYTHNYVSVRIGQIHNNASAFNNVIATQTLSIE